MKKLYLISLICLGLISVVFGIGFHSAEEILPGNFNGNYSFQDEVEVNTINPISKLFVGGNFEVKDLGNSWNHTNATLTIGSSSLDQQDLAIGHWLSASSNDWQGIGVIGNNFYVGRANDANHFKFVNTHPAISSSGIIFGSNYIDFFSNGPVGSTVDEIFTPDRIVRFGYDGTIDVDGLGTGTLYTSSGVLTNTNPSDIRLKENIRNLSGSLNKVVKLNPVSFDWKNGEGPSIGFIAQDVEKVIPELVSTNGDYLGLKTTEFIPYLVDAIKEQQKQIELQNQKIIQLEFKIVQLKNK